VTRLPPRKILDEDLPALLARMGADRLPLCAIFVDIDHFKSFNDTWGHRIGDRVLGHVAGLVRSAVRYRGEAYRYGGEEIVVLLPNACRSEGIATADRMCRIVADSRIEMTPDDSTVSAAGRSDPGGAPSRDAPGSLGVTISAGVCSTEDVPGSELITMADRAMYHAKDSGRNRAVLYEKQLERYQLSSTIEARFPGNSSVSVNNRIIVKAWRAQSDETGVMEIDVHQLRNDDMGIIEYADPAKVRHSSRRLLTSEFPGRITSVERREDYTFFTIEVKPDTLDVMMRKTAGSDAQA